MGEFWISCCIGQILWYNLSYYYQIFDPLLLDPWFLLLRPMYFWFNIGHFSFLSSNELNLLANVADSLRDCTYCWHKSFNSSVMPFFMWTVHWLIKSGVSVWFQLHNYKIFVFLSIETNTLSNKKLLCIQMYIVNKHYIISDFFFNHSLFKSS